MHWTTILSCLFIISTEKMWHSNELLGQMNSYLLEYDTVILNKRDEAQNPLFYKFYLFFLLIVSYTFRVEYISTKLKQPTNLFVALYLKVLMYSAGVYRVYFCTFTGYLNLCIHLCNFTLNHRILFRLLLFVV